MVTLPAVHTSSSIKSTMLIIEHGNKDVLFVDATSLFQRERRMMLIFQMITKIF